MRDWKLIFTFLICTFLLGLLLFTSGAVVIVLWAFVPDLIGTRSNLLRISIVICIFGIIILLCVVFLYLYHIHVGLTTRNHTSQYCTVNELSNKSYKLNSPSSSSMPDPITEGSTLLNASNSLGSLEFDQVDILKLLCKHRQRENYSLTSNNNDTVTTHCANMDNSLMSDRSNKFLLLDSRRHHHKLSTVFTSNSTSLCNGKELLGDCESVQSRPVIAKTVTTSKLSVALNLTDSSGNSLRMRRIRSDLIRCIKRTNAPLNSSHLVEHKSMLNENKDYERNKYSALGDTVSSNTTGSVDFDVTTNYRKISSMSYTLRPNFGLRSKIIGDDDDDDDDELDRQEIRNINQTNHHVLSCVTLFSDAEDEESALMRSSTLCLQKMSPKWSVFPIYIENKNYDLLVEQQPTCDDCVNSKQRLSKSSNATDMIKASSTNNLVERQRAIKQCKVTDAIGQRIINGLNTFIQHLHTPWRNNATKKNVSNITPLTDKQMSYLKLYEPVNVRSVSVAAVQHLADYEPLTSCQPNTTVAKPNTESTDLNKLAPKQMTQATNASTSSLPALPPALWSIERPVWIKLDPPDLILLQSDLSDEQMREWITTTDSVSSIYAFHVRPPPRLKPMTNSNKYTRTRSVGQILLTTTPVDSLDDAELVDD